MKKDLKIYVFCDLKDSNTERREALYTLGRELYNLNKLFRRFIAEPKFEFKLQYAKVSRIGVKSAVLGTAVYYTIDKGVWKDSATTSAIYEDLESGVSPYVGELKKQIPYDLPPLPSNDRLSYLMKYYWNCGVKSTFNFLVNLPTHTSNAAVTTYEFISSSLDAAAQITNQSQEK